MHATPATSFHTLHSSEDKINRYSEQTIRLVSNYKESLPLKHYACEFETIRIIYIYTGQHIHECDRKTHVVLILVVSPYILIYA